MNLLNKDSLKGILGEIPLTAELYWLLRQPGKTLDEKFSLDRLEQHLPAWRSEAGVHAHSSRQGKQILIFGVLRYWIEHVTLLGMSLAGLGHKVTLAFMPYAYWQAPLSRFDARRQNAYAERILRQGAPVLDVVSFFSSRKARQLPAGLNQQVKESSLRDAQYTLQVEDIVKGSELYRLRLERNTEMARAGLAWMEAHRPQVVVVPNGSILEFGILYHVARQMGIDVVTYEFGEQRQRIWLAQNSDVMRQETDDLWRARAAQPLTSEQTKQIRALFAARQRASSWENFSRRWQGTPSEGGERARATLGLDQRPVVLLATNVIGDSLTLGRQVFSDSMTEWLERTVAYFAGRPDVQLVIRIHPGELITKGPSVADVVRSTLDGLPGKQPDNVLLVAAGDPVNTYDLVEIADLGLVYTTTLGMEMAMSGAPVIAVGSTHYRGKGFTLDPDSWESFFNMLDQVLGTPETFRPTNEQVEKAWNYAYRFFFDYPFPFPWHLLHMWDDVQEWPVKRVLDEEGRATFGNTFRYLSGEPIDWS